jgi:hypothetical protein
MPQVEAAACGIPIASVDYSAMTEIVSKLDGYAIPVNRVFRELETNADRVYPDIDATTDIMYNFFVNTTEEQRKAKNIETRQKCISYYTWDNVYSVWEECFNSIDITKKLSWSSQPMPQPSHKSIKVPKNLSNTNFVEYICHHVLNNRDLLKTANIQSLIRDLSNGIIARDGNMTMINKNQAINILESYLNNQISCEKMRSEPQAIPKEDFIQ